MSAAKAAARWAVRRAARPRQWCLIGSGDPCPQGTKTRGFRRASVSPPCASVLIARPATSSRPAPAATHSSLRMNQRFFFRARVDPMIGGSSVSSLSMRRRLCTLPFLPPLGIAGRGEGSPGLTPSPVSPGDVNPARELGRAKKMVQQEKKLLYL